jgi:polysaccharide export outer membrane protein
MAALCFALAGSAVWAEPAAEPDVASQAKAAEARAAALAAEARQAAAVAAAADEEYRIGFSDLLEISVFQVKELDRSVRVNSRGVITLPLLGAIKAGGLTASELEAEIAKRLQENYLQDPQVSVFIKEYTSQRVTVEGEVEKAGIYPITGKTTLLQSIALAGGLKALANPSEVRVFRLDAGGTRQMLVFDVDKVRSGDIPDPSLQNNDIVVIETSAGRSFVKSVTDTIRGLVTFGRF